MVTQTNNVSRQEPLTVESILDVFESMREMLARVKKLRYRETPLAPMAPVISKTKSYEMVIIHPASMQAFLAQCKLSEFQLPVFGLSPATDAEWMEWSKELAEQLGKKMRRNFRNC